jgi:hypothetical protein
MFFATWVKDTVLGKPETRRQTHLKVEGVFLVIVVHIIAESGANF